ncbi:ATP-dependent DNA helicase DDX11-like isoform X2 [Stegodyphus dumicola]|nr:ATP-dependent DNA helicase DDX11-like isoform X2 [Stegodyphus dumicola]
MGEEISFPFPFPPYDVQKEFMKELYSVLQNKKVGIFESPTGTGKSLSIICGALKWLKDFQENKKAELQNILKENCEDTEDDWFNNFLKKQEKAFKVEDAKKELKILNEYEERINDLRLKFKTKKASFVLDTHNSKRRKYENTAEDNKIIDEDLLLDVLQDEDEKDDCKEEKTHVLKIYYSSRTHSQLAQFLGEIKRSPYRDLITVTALGSRANYCINEAVSKLKNLSLINDQCVELQRKKATSKKCCPFIKNLSDMQDSILSSVKDIEEIVHMGKELLSCPYYASRNVIPDVELVVLPYNILMHKATRDAYGIVLKNNVLIIDEAHNLVEAINGMYSAEITGLCLLQSIWQIDAYFKQYNTRLSQKNVRFTKLLISVLNSFLGYVKSSNSISNSDKSSSCISNLDKSSSSISNSDSRMMSCYEFISSCGVSHVNFFELVKFCEDSLIGNKLHRFTSARVAKGISPMDDQNKKTELPEISPTTAYLSQLKEKKSSVAKEAIVENKHEYKEQYKPSAFFTFIHFLKTLTFPTEYGRVLFNKASTVQKSSLKFLHLNPAAHFQEIIQEARSVVVAGGTMQPISEFVDQLFMPAGVPKERISFFSCGHVIPSENLLAIGIETGPCGSMLDFTFKSRQLPQTVKEVGSVLLNICNSVQGGIVCFLPSYNYEEFIYKELKKSKILDSIAKRKKIFREPKFSSDVDRILSDYAKSISLACSSNSGSSTCTGSLLFSIVGGKMSEGINFSDDLGRCVIMVGLPYPNKFSVELKEKMSYLNQKGVSLNIKNAGDIYYNNLCMKAVNQSIGRAIRHKNDYAAIVLLDYRYNTSVVKDSLPSWISKSFTFHQKFGPAFFALRKFFAVQNNTTVKKT